MTIQILLSDDRPQTSCLALLSYRGQIMADVLPAIAGLLAAGWDVACMSGASMVSRARSEFATKLVDHSGYQRVVWADDDILFRERDVLELAECGPELVGAAYARRGSHGSPAYELAEETTAKIARVRWCGTGLLYTDRIVFEEIRKRHGLAEFDGIVPYFLPLLINDRFASEDVSFCVRAALAGVEPRVNRAVRVAHRETIDTYPRESS